MNSDLPSLSADSAPLRETPASLSDAELAAGVLQLAARKGVTLRLGDDGKVLATPKAALDDKLRACITANRAALVAALERQRALARNRFGQAPPTGPDLGLQPAPEELTGTEWHALCDYVRRQGDPVRQWAFERSWRYHLANPNWAPLTGEGLAALDLLLWQREGMLKGASRPDQARELAAWVLALGE